MIRKPLDDGDESGGVTDARHTGCVGRHHIVAVLGCHTRGGAPVEAAWEPGF